MTEPLVLDIRGVLAAAGTARYRAKARGALRGSARRAMAVVLAAAVLDCALLVPGHLDRLAGTFLPNVLAAVAAFAAYVWIARARRPPVEWLILGVLLVVDVAIVAVQRLDLEGARLGAGYQLLLPPIVALLIPWSTRFHLGWLAMHAIVVVAAAGAALPGVALPGGATVLLDMLVVSSGLSLVGHLSNLHARVDAFLRIEQIRAMNRLARRDDIQLRRLNTLLERVSRTDRLTGLGNRAALHEQLIVIRSRVERYGERYAVLLLDLDHFKGINDGLGHFAGDEILRLVARALARATRISDTAFRFGGEEFIALLPLGVGDATLAAADRVRRAIENLAIAHPANEPYCVVTVSIGACEVSPASLGVADDTWLGQADVALYAAKDAGRNRVIVAKAPARERRHPLRGVVVVDSGPAGTSPVGIAAA